MAKKAEKKVEVRTEAFANPRIRKTDGSVIRSQRGWQITDSEKYPMTKFERMLVDEAEKHGGSVTLAMEVTINLNRPAEDIDTEGLPILD